MSSTAPKKVTTPGAIASLPLWLKDFGAIAATGIVFLAATLLYSTDRYYLQIISAIGVSIIVAIGLNLIVGYIGQVALGHAGFVAIGGYMLGILLGRIPGKLNWIDYLYTSVDPTGKPLPTAELNKRELERFSVENLMLVIFIALFIATLVAGGFLFWRYRHVRQTGGVAERHFWQNPGIMRTLTWVVFGGGGLASLGVYIATIASSKPNDAGRVLPEIPWVYFGIVLSLTLVLGYLAYSGYKTAATYTGGIRPSFWDKPDWVRRTLILTVAVGGTLTFLAACLWLFGLRFVQNFWAALILGAVVAGIFGYLLALPALRVKGPYLAMVTIAFGLIIVELGNSTILQPILGSSNGITGIPYPTSGRDPQRDIIVQPSSAEVATTELFLTTLIVGAFAVLTLYIVRNLIRSRWGRSFIALRENEIGASSVGINVTRMKTLAFVLSAVLTGIAGVLNSYAVSFINPNFALLSVSVAYITMIILGGAGTLFGPILGAILITIIPQVLRRLENARPAEDVFSLVGYIAPWLLLALIAAYFATRNNNAPGLQRAARLLSLPVILGFGGLSVAGIALGFDEPARFWSYVALVVGTIIVLAIAGWAWFYAADKSPAVIFATLAGIVATFVSFDFFPAIAKTLGLANGIGVAKGFIDISGLGFLGLYVAAVIVALVITTSPTRKLAVRGFAAGFVFTIPFFYRLIIGILQGSDARDFKPLVVELTMYGAILLYFLYLVPKGVGGLVADFMDRYFPTRRTLERHANNEAGRQLAFHRQRDSQDELLRLGNVSRYFKGLKAVDSVEIPVKRGAIHALIGPNGAGKTTVLNLISGIYPVTSGEILFRDERIDGLKPHRVAEKGISRTFQNLQVFGDMTALENVMVGFHLHTRQGFWASLLGLPSVYREEERIKGLALNLLEFVGLGDRAYAKAKDLPYGYQRLLEIARALAVEPEVLLLDEPAAGLNPHEIGDMDRIIRKIQAEGVTVVLIEHHMDLVMEISDDVTVLDYGKKIAEGNPAHVQNDQKVKDAYFGPEVVLDARS